MEVVMSEHIVKKHLEKYGKRELSSAERVKVILHLSKCEGCLKEFQEMFPNITNPNQGIVLPPSETGTDEPFHLNFEEHFQPFVDNEISEIDREIVESHVKVCSFCAASLRDLQEFRQKLELQEIVAGQHQTGVWQKIAAFFNYNYKPLALAFGLVLTVGLGIMFWLKFPKGEETIAQNSPIPFETPIKSENSNVADNVNQQITVETNKNSNKSENTNQQPKDIEETTNELAGLSGSAKETVARAIKTEKIEIPAFLALLMPRNGNARGPNSGNQTSNISPNNAVLQTSQPTFSWQKQNGAENYEIEIYDEKFNTIKQSPKLNVNNWRSDENLPRGMVLHWEVKADNQKSAESTQHGTFYILDEKNANEIEQVETNKQISSLARGIVYARAGLLQKAEGEFKKYLAENPSSKIAKRFLNQLLRSK